MDIIKNKLWFRPLIISTLCLLTALACVPPVENTIPPDPETGAGMAMNPGGLSLGGINTVEISAGEMQGGEMQGGEIQGGEMQGGEINRPDRLTCNVGDPLGLCVACGPNNTEIQATRDDRCEAIDCSTLNRYRTVSDENGLLECRYQEYVDGPSICQGFGACFTEAERYCESQVEMVVVAKTEITSCYTLEGCSGEIEPELVPQPGAACEDGLGMCDEEGECVVMASCLTLFDFDYNTDTQLCNDRLTTQGYCDFYIKSAGNPWGVEEVTCAQFCSAQGGSCITAISDSDNGCNYGDERGCNSDHGDVICRCAPPQ